MISSTLALWRKECYALCSPLAVALLVLIWLAWGIYFLAAFQEYQALAPKLATLSVPRGASEMLLLPVNRLMLWLIALWIVFFTARLIAEEYTAGTVRMYHRRVVAWLLAKIGMLLLFGALFTLPFWLAVAWLSSVTQLDRGILVGIFTAQVLILVYCCAMACSVALWLRQPLACALLCALLLVLLWLLPGLVSSPAGLVAMFQWLSPFAHSELLTGGQFALQTLLFILFHGAFFLSFIVYFQLEDR